MVGSASTAGHSSVADGGECETVRLKVSEKALEQTTECGKYHACLAGHIYRICKVKTLAGSDRLLCNSVTKEFSCNYSQRFRKSHVCLCPVRKELFSRYGI